MNNSFTQIFALFLVVGLSVSAVAEDRPLQVFVLAGTSNMHSRNARGDDLPADLRPVRKDVLVYQNNVWAPLEAGKNLVGNEATFGQAMTKHLGEPIGIIRMNVGHASDRSLGKKLNQIVKQAAEKGRPIVIARILLDVSFRDGIEEQDALDYKSNLIKWVASIRQEIGDPELPIAMNRAIPPVPKTPHLELVRKAQDSLELPNFHVFPCDDVPKGRDHIHFTTAGRLEMGKRFAAAMIELMPAEQRILQPGKRG